MAEGSVSFASAKLTRWSNRTGVALYELRNSFCRKENSGVDMFIVIRCCWPQRRTLSHSASALSLLSHRRYGPFVEVVHCTAQLVH